MVCDSSFDKVAQPPNANANKMTNQTRMTAPENATPASIFTMHAPDDVCIIGSTRTLGNPSHADARLVAAPSPLLKNR